MIKKNQNNLLTALQVACDRVAEVRLYIHAVNQYFMEDKIIFYSSDRAVTTFEKTLKLLNSNIQGFYKIKYFYDLGICEIWID